MCTCVYMSYIYDIYIYDMYTLDSHNKQEPRHVSQLQKVASVKQRIAAHDDIDRAASCLNSGQLLPCQQHKENARQCPSHEAIDI